MCWTYQTTAKSRTIQNGIETCINVYVSVQPFELTKMKIILINANIRFGFLSVIMSFQKFTITWSYLLAKLKSLARSKTQLLILSMTFMYNISVKSVDQFESCSRLKWLGVSGWETAVLFLWYGAFFDLKVGHLSLKTMK